MMKMGIQRAVFCIYLAACIFALADSRDPAPASGKSSAFLPHTETNKANRHTDLTRTLELRGGDNVRHKVAKTVSAVQLINSVTRWLLPAQHVKLYGQVPTPQAEFMMKAIAIRIFCPALTCYRIFFQDADPLKSLGLSMMAAFGVDLLGFLMMRNKLGIHVSRKVLVDAACVGLGYLAYTEHPYASMGIKIFGIVSALHGVFMATDTAGALQKWGIQDVSRMLRLWAKWYALFSLELGVFVGSLGWGRDPIKALGYSYIPSALLIADFTFRGPASTLGFNKPLLIGWWLVSVATVASSILL